MPTKKKKVRPPRDMAVPLMRQRGGKGPHADKKKKQKRETCRKPVDTDEESA